MRLSFDSIEEVKEFVKQLKGTRGGKSDAADEPQGQAPAPLQPPAGGAAPALGFPSGAAGFAPPAPGATAAVGAFPAAGAPATAPEVQTLVTRIAARIDGCAAAGSDVNAMLNWLRGQVGAGAEQATMDQIKTVFLPKQAVPQLENIAKLMAA